MPRRRLSLNLPTQFAQGIDVSCDCVLCEMSQFRVVVERVRPGTSLLRFLSLVQHLASSKNVLPYSLSSTVDTKHERRRENVNFDERVSVELCRKSLFRGSCREVRCDFFVVVKLAGHLLSSCLSSHVMSSALVPLAQQMAQMAKRSHPFTDEASKDTGASSKTQPRGTGVLVLASVRHQKNPPLISAQHKSQVP